MDKEFSELCQFKPIIRINKNEALVMLQAKLQRMIEGSYVYFTMGIFAFDLSRDLSRLSALHIQDMIVLF